MIKAQLYNDTGEKKGNISLPAEIFGFKPRESAVYEAIKNYLANQRQGTANTKTKGEVRGGGRKPWRQKGTGRARSGSIRSPLWKGGGTIFGPRVRNYSYSIPKKLKRQALFSALSHRASQGNVFVIEKPGLKKPMTKSIELILKQLDLYGKKILVIYKGKDENFYKSCRNIRNLSVIEAYKLNPYEVLKSKYMLITTDGLEQLKEVFK
ncbi:50S ribosomal protein L4 [candidate division WOR-3 bacterium]|nr:50S ribosomal protein L4 [candidate division WOR-3 bacterium]